MRERQESLSGGPSLQNLALIQELESAFGGKGEKDSNALTVPKATYIESQEEKREEGGGGGEGGLI